MKAQSGSTGKGGSKGSRTLRPEGAIKKKMPNPGAKKAGRHAGLRQAELAKRGDRLVVPKSKRGR
jgi:hypothetical protein